MDKRGLYDIYSVWHVPFWKTNSFRYGIYAFIGLTVLAIGFFLYRWIKNRTKKVELWQQAMTDLDVLLLKHDNVSNVYAQLTDLLKRYLSQRYECKVHAHTDQELMVHIQQLQIPADVCTDVKNILDGATEIKFANITVARAKLEEAVALAKQCIQRTIPSGK